MRFLGQANNHKSFETIVMGLDFLGVRMGFLQRGKSHQRVSDRILSLTFGGARDGELISLGPTC